MKDGKPEIDPTAFLLNSYIVIAWTRAFEDGAIPLGRDHDSTVCTV